jgi:hypothetical protein
METGGRVHNARRDVRAAADSVRALEKSNKPKQKQAQERALGEVVAQCLVTPFVEACVACNRASCTALAQVRNQSGVIAWLPMKGRDRGCNGWAPAFLRACALAKGPRLAH